MSYRLACPFRSSEAGGGLATNGAAGSARTQGGLKPFGDYTYKELVDLGVAIAGSPESARKQLLESQGTLGRGTLATLL